MTEDIRIYFDQHRNGNGGDDSLSPCHSLTNAVARLLQKRWEDEPPAPQCFDFDESRMARLISFIECVSPGTAFDDVSEHLIECARCRFLYSLFRDFEREKPKQEATYTQPAFDGNADPIPTLLCQHLRSTGHVVFPGGQVADGAWEFGRLANADPSIAEQIGEMVGERAWQELRDSLPHKEVVVVCFSHPVHRCGKRFAAKMVEAGINDVHVVMADDFFNPRLWCDPRELHGRHVIVFVDIVRSGGLLERIYSVCREAQPRDIVGLAIIDQSRGYTPSAPLRALWLAMPKKRFKYNSMLHAKARFFDPSSATATRVDGLPVEVADPTNARATVERQLAAIEPLFPYIEATGALKQDAQIGGVCYPWAMDLLRLLSHDEARAELSRRAVERLADLAARGPWCLVYPAERHKRAGEWAELLSETLRWPVVKVGLKSRIHFRPLTAGQRKQLAKCSRALVVDAAIRTGKTLDSLVTVVRSGLRPVVPEIVSFYAFDGLFSGPRDKLQENLGVEIRSLFQLPLGAPTDPVGQYCRRRLQDTLGELNGMDVGAAAGWVDVVRAYCKKKLERLHAPAKQRHGEEIERNLRRAFDEGQRGAQARLEHACYPPRPSLVKHLDVTYALREPRTRNVLHGFLCNSMPPEFIESCAMALATQEDYDWFDRDWLMLHKRLFTNGASQRWQFLACIGYWMRRRADAEQTARARQAVEEFRRHHVGGRSSLLFPESPSSPALPETVDERCETLVSVLTPD